MSMKITQQSSTRAALNESIKAKPIHRAPVTAFINDSSSVTFHKPSCFTNLCKWIVSIFKSCFQSFFPSKKTSSLSESSKTDQPKLFSEKALNNWIKGYINSIMDKGTNFINKSLYKAVFVLKLDGRVVDAYWSSSRREEDQEARFKETLQKRFANAVKGKQAATFEVKAVFIEHIDTDKFHLYPFQGKTCFNETGGCDGSCGNTGLERDVTEKRVKELLASQFKGLCESPKQEESYCKAMTDFADPMIVDFLNPLRNSL